MTTTLHEIEGVTQDSITSRKVRLGDESGALPEGLQPSDATVQNAVDRLLARPRA